jgi:DNA-binding IclR family transcriptional regulator
VILGAVQRLDRRSYVGAEVGNIGMRWQPDPVPGRAAHPRLHTLALRAGAIASLAALHLDRLRMICAAAPRGHRYVPQPEGCISVARTAPGRVLCAAQPISDVVLSECSTLDEWRRLRERIRQPQATITDHQEAVAGICRVSAPVWRSNRSCADAVTARSQSAKVPPNMHDLVSLITDHISAELQS